MKRWEKILAWGLFALVCGAGLVAYSFYHHVHRTIPDCYAQWATAELIIDHRKDRKRMPANWAELEPYYERASPHSGGLSFDQMQERIHIDFLSLPKLELDYGDQRVPEVITCVSGVGAHWEKAEPNELVNSEFTK